MAEAAGAGVAAELVRRIQSHVRMLAETHGAIGVARPELAEDLRSFPSPPFVLFFRYAADRLQVVRILHERQDVDRHL